MNQRATELFLATTNFTAKSVPLLPGAIVVATHDADREQTENRTPDPYSVRFCVCSPGIQSGRVTPPAEATTTLAA